MANDQLYQEAIMLLDDALDQLKRHGQHDAGCPRSRDDLPCNCGLSDTKDDIKEFLEKTQ